MGDACKKVPKTKGKKWGTIIKGSRMILGMTSRFRRGGGVLEGVGSLWVLELFGVYVWKESLDHVVCWFAGSSRFWFAFAAASNYRRRSQV